MANLSKIIAGFIAPKVVSDVLANQNPKELGMEVGKGIRKIITNQIGERAYLSITKVLVAWFDALYVATRKELL